MNKQPILLDFIQVYKYSIFVVTPENKVESKINCGGNWFMILDIWPQLLPRLIQGKINKTLNTVD